LAGSSGIVLSEVGLLASQVSIASVDFPLETVKLYQRWNNLACQYYDRSESMLLGRYYTMEQEQDRMRPQIKKVRKYWVTRTKLMLGGLLAIIIIILQDLISLGVFNSSKMLDWPLVISAFAFAVALPLLSVQLLATIEDESRFWTFSDPWYLIVTYVVGILGAVVGIFFAFWHIWPPVAIASLVAMVIGAGAYVLYRAKLLSFDKQERAAGRENIRDYEGGSTPPSSVQGQEVREEVSQPQDVKRGADGRIENVKGYQEGYRPPSSVQGQ
jgi:hypothetical protein